MKNSTLRLAGYIVVIFGFMCLLSGIISPDYMFMVFIGVPLLIGGVIVYLLGVQSSKKKYAKEDKEFVEIDDIIDHYKPK